MVGKILIPEIKSLIEARDFNALREIFCEWPPADLAEIIPDLPEDDQVIIFRVLPAALAADSGLVIYFTVAVFILRGTLL